MLKNFLCPLPLFSPNNEEFIDLNGVQISSAHVLQILNDNSSMLAILSDSFRNDSKQIVRPI